MLQKLRDNTQSTGFKILVVAIILVLTLFGFGASNVFLSSSPSIVTVGDFEITQSVLEAETERERRRLLSQAGADFDPSQIDRIQLQQYTLQQLISREVLNQTAADLGVRVPASHVNDRLYTEPGYQVDGKFNEAVYRQNVEMMGYTPPAFIDWFTNLMSGEQIRGGLADSPLIPEWELAETVRLVNQRRDVAFLPLTVENFSADVEVSEEEIALRYDEDEVLYQTELAVDAAYVKLAVEDLLQSPEINVTDEDLQELYNEQRSEALRDQQRDSSHILVQINADRDEAAALELITEIATRINNGEAFEALARELSEDPGSAEQDGALGAVGKGIFDPEFEQALWALQSPGDISEPVKTAFGYHLIRLNEVVERDYPAFASQREALEEQLRRLQAEELFVEEALNLERSAFDEGFSLDESAAAFGLTVQKLQRVSRGAPGDDEVLSNPSVLQALFEDEVLDGENSRPVELDNNSIVIVRVDEQYPPQPIPLADVADDIRQTLVREQALEKIALARESGLTELRAGESVTEVANRLGGRWQTASMVGRSGTPDMPREVLQYAFELPRPAAGAKSVGAVDLPDGAALVTVTRVVQGDINSTTDADVSQIRQLTTQRSGRFDFQSFFVAAEAALGVERPGS